MSKVTYNDLMVSRLFPSGGYEVSALVNGYFERQTYFGYTKREALRRAHQYFNEAAK